MNNQISKNIVERVNIVPEAERLDFLCENFGTPLFDQLVFRVADKIVKSYSGGYFEYCTLEDSKAAFLRLGSQDGHTLINPFTGVEVEKVGDTPAGMVVTLYAVGWIIEDESGNYPESLHDIYQDLRSAIISYCDETADWSVFYCLID